jgi:hypothetical protein
VFTLRISALNRHWRSYFFKHFSPLPPPPPTHLIHSAPTPPSIPLPHEWECKEAANLQQSSFGRAPGLSSRLAYKPLSLYSLESEI